ARVETSFCQQANNTRAFEGGIRSRRYRNCRDCVPGLNPAERRALDEADKACRNVMGTNRGEDPTGGAQYWYAPGHIDSHQRHWMHEQMRRGNCWKVDVPGCRTEFYKCRNRPMK